MEKCGNIAPEYGMLNNSSSYLNPGLDLKPTEAFQVLGGLSHHHLNSSTSDTSKVTS
jgi:hypothetical protein